MIAENIKKVQNRIKEACKRADRDPRDITLVCVAKKASLHDILEAINAGIADLGENRVQDALDKQGRLRDKKLTWHMIGHLQRNKVKDALKIFDFVHSVDSFKLAQAIQKEAVKQKKLADVLIEANVSGEKSKFGVRPEDVIPLIEKITPLSGVRVLGLMAMSPLTDDPEKSRPYFKKLKGIFDDVNNKIQPFKLKYLSMGMTQDFEVAVEEGANIVRIGRAIFGE